MDQDVRITATTAATSGPVLAVPEAAVFASADERTYVTVVSGAGRQRDVPVHTGTSANGLVEITPLATPLRAGDKVAIGQ
jgi:hypothetical protein